MYHKIKLMCAQNELLFEQYKPILVQGGPAEKSLFQDIASSPLSRKKWD